MQEYGVKMCGFAVNEGLLPRTPNRQSDIGCAREKRGQAVLRRPACGMRVNVNSYVGCSEYKQL